MLQAFQYAVTCVWKILSIADSIMRLLTSDGLSWRFSSSFFFFFLSQSTLFTLLVSFFFQPHIISLISSLLPVSPWSICSMKAGIILVLFTVDSAVSRTLLRTEKPGKKFLFNEYLKWIKVFCTVFVTYQLHSKYWWFFSFSCYAIYSPFSDRCHYPYVGEKGRFL